MLVWLRRFCLVTGLTMLCTSLFAQKVTINGKFATDSIKIGEVVPFILTAKYPQDSVILFPDSTSLYSPFDLDHKVIFPTQTALGISRDSTVYYLTTFEIDSILYLQLPVFEAHASDCTRYTSTIDSIFIAHVLKTPPPPEVKPEDLPLKTDTRYIPVQIMFNYPLPLIALIAFLGLLVILWIIFGKKIQRYFRLKRVKSRFDSFIRTFDEHCRQIQGHFTKQKTEETCALWKKYMEDLESRPYTKLTTRETMLIEKDPGLGKNLQSLDRAIYGHDSAVLQPLEGLKMFAENRFNKKISEIRDGR